MACLLGIETSADLCSVALQVAGTNLLFKKSIHMPYGQAGHLLGLMQDVLTEAELDWPNIRGVVVNRGPGSFTGIRVGLATAQGLSLAGEIPLFGLTGFEIYRSLSNVEKDLFVLIDTRRNDCFASFFKQGALNPQFCRVMSYEEVKEFVDLQKNLFITGNLTAADLQHENAQFHFLESHNLLHAYAFYEGKKPDLFDSEPYYLREPEINVSSKSLRT